MTDPLAGASFEMADANIIPLPLGEMPRQLAGARKDCATLRGNILTVQQCLGALEGLLEGLPGAAFDTLRGQMSDLNELLALRLDQLSGTDRLLQEILSRQPS